MKINVNALIKLAKKYENYYGQDFIIHDYTIEPDKPHIVLESNRGNITLDPALEKSEYYCDAVAYVLSGHMTDKLKKLVQLGGIKEPYFDGIKHIVEKEQVQDQIIVKKVKIEDETVNYIRYIPQHTTDYPQYRRTIGPYLFKYLDGRDTRKLEVFKKNDTAIFRTTNIQHMKLAHKLKFRELVNKLYSFINPKHITEINHIDTTETNSYSVSSSFVSINYRVNNKELVPLTISMTRTYPWVIEIVNVYNEGSYKLHIPPERGVGEDEVFPESVKDVPRFIKVQPIVEFPIPLPEWARTLTLYSTNPCILFNGKRICWNGSDVIIVDHKTGNIQKTLPRSTLFALFKLDEDKVISFIEML